MLLRITHYFKDEKYTLHRENYENIRINLFLKSPSFVINTHQTSEKERSKKIWINIFTRLSEYVF